DIDALPHVHLAEEGSHAAVGQHRDPRIELVGSERRLVCTRRLAECRVSGAGHHDADNERAAGLEKVAPREMCLTRHGRPYAFDPAARFTAPTIAMWVPQRRLIPARACRIC